MEKIDFMKVCLHKFDYPSVNIMSDEEITSIFSVQNRIPLTKWILRLVHHSFESLLLNATNSDIAELLKTNGFCNEVEKLKFLNGELGNDEEMSILYKMFKTVSNRQEATCLDLDTVPFVDMDRLHEMYSRNTNLLPHKPPKPAISLKTKQNKILQYEKLIKDLKPTDTEDFEDLATLEKELAEEMEIFNEHLKKADVKINRFLLKILEVNTELRERSVSCDLDEKTLENINKNLNQIEEYVKGYNHIANLENQAPNKIIDNHKAIQILTELKQTLA